MSSNTDQLERSVSGDALYCVKCEKEMKIDMLGGGQVVYRCPKCKYEVSLVA